MRPEEVDLDIPEFDDDEVNEPTSEQPEEERPADIVPDEPVEDEDAEEAEDAEESEESEEAEEAEEEEAEPESKIKVTLQDEDGNDIERDLTAQEIREGFMMRQAFTRKTQEAAQKVRDTEAKAAERVQVMQDAHLQSLVQQQHMLQQLANVPDQNEMMRLAATDKEGWINAQMRQQQFSQVFSSIQQQIQHQQYEIQQRQKQQHDEAYEAAWVELAASGFNQNKLGETYAKAQELFGVQSKTLEALDPGLAKALAVAVNAKTPAKPDKSKRLPKAMPKKPKASNPQSHHTRQQRDRDGRFTSGRASLQDAADAMDFSGL